MCLMDAWNTAMTTILVVHDSAVDRKLVGGLLGKDASLKVDFAANGLEALAKMEAEIVDLVVTDLIMPQMDGLSLVSAVGQRFHLVPVILMTSKGSEELAVQALAGLPVTCPDGSSPSGCWTRCTTCWRSPGGGGATSA